MNTRITNVFAIAEDDIEQLISEWDSVSGWLKAHLSTRWPAHRCEGELVLDNEKLVFTGRDIKEGRYLQLAIPLENITGVNIGFSTKIKDSLDPTFGIGGHWPFVVRHQRNGESQTIYFNTCSDNYPPHQDSNLRWYEVLQEMVTKRKCQDSRHPDHRVPVGVLR